MDLQYIFAQLSPGSRFQAEHALLVPQLQEYLAAIRADINREKLEISPFDSACHNHLLRTHFQLELIQQFEQLITTIKLEKEQHNAIISIANYNDR
jgi:hypothetical protein